jgi:catechol 2,3-dioxygenase-like lactoylglutathione lyase family enzyme
MFTRIDNVGICTRDLARSVSFYERLGFSTAYENERGRTLTMGGITLFLFQTHQARAAPVHREHSLFGNPPGLDHISFRVADVDRTYAALVAAGVECAGAPADQSWGARVVAFKDPDGNNLYALQWPAHT